MNTEKEFSAYERDCSKMIGARHEKMTVRARIDRMAERSGDDVFLVSPETGRCITFWQFAQHARNFCCKLLSQGLAPGDKVASLLDNGLFTAEWILGTMYGGFVPVPLNPFVSAGEIERLLEHSEAKILFVSKEHLDVVNQFTTTQVCLEVVGCDEPIAHDNGFEACSLELVSEEDDALLAYTSGSTGRPKGVVVSHRNLIEGGQNTINAHQLTHKDHSLCVLPLYHMNAQVVTLMATLLSGGAVVLPRRFDAAQFWSWIAEYRCTWFALVPSLVSQLVSSSHQRELRENCACVRFARSSSAPLPPLLHRAFEEKFSMPLIEAMGITEAGGAVFSNPLPPALREVGSPGFPWGFKCRIVGPGGREVSDGSTGEILVRGPSVMKGYFKDQEGTAEVLDYDGWLRTGDLGYKNQNGFIFIRGRIKEIINRGGEKIAPREIDEMLSRHPALQEAAVVAVPDRTLGEDIVACVVLKDEAVCTEGELLEFCSSSLGSLKTPSRVYFVDYLPRGPSGKVQRMKLTNQLALSPSAALMANSDIETRNHLSQHEVEDRLIDLWSTFLGCERVDVEDNFFELGGYSLLAIRMLSRLRECFDVELSLSFFFEHPTVASQAAVIVHMEKNSCPPLDGVPDSYKRKKIFPLSSAQQRLLFIQMLDPDATVYNESEAFRLEGLIDIVALEQALEAIITRHEMLRTTIGEEDGVAVQMVHQHIPIRLLRIDLSCVPQGELEVELRSTLTAQAGQPFDLGRQLVSTVLIKLSQNEHVLLLMLHHLVCDGWSMGILYRELSQFYSTCKTKEMLMLESLPCQYATFVERERIRLADAEAIEPDITFWKDRLCDAPELLTLPTDRPRPAIYSYKGATLPVRINSRLSERLRRIAKREKVSLFTVVAAAYSTLLYRYSGQSDVMIGIPFAHRSQPELSQLIGMLVDVVVLRIDLSGEPSFRQVMVNTAVAIGEAISHSTVPFSKVIDVSGQTRSLDHAPLFQVMLNWRDPEAQTDLLCLDGLRVYPMDVEKKTAKFDLTLFLTDTGTEISGQMEYNTDLFNSDTIERLVEHFLTLLAAIVTDLDQTISELPLLTEAERDQLLFKWNETKTKYPNNKCIHQLFEIQVEKSPDTVALVYEDDKLTYRELNEQSNQLAYYLRECGVGPNILVGICVERSLEMVISLLGILKAGGAYVPLDPSYPKERLEFMLVDTKAPVLITDKNVVDTLSFEGVQVICMNRVKEKISSCGIENLPNLSNSEDLAYVIYTSGSTGVPKGVEVPHRGVLRLLFGVDYVKLGAGETFLQLAPISFDASTFEIWGALLHGAKCVLFPERIPTPGDLGDVIKKYGGSVLWLTSSLFNTVIDEEPEALSTLKQLLIGGEALSVSHVRRALELLPSTQIINGYGPTENTTFTCCYKIPRQICNYITSIPIGRPIGNTEVYILDTHLNLVPVGVYGELYASGAGLARGYLNQPELTAERFIPNPFSEEPDARLYKTGDLARYLPDGNIEFLGRIDNQVKVRGYRIELGGIEANLVKHPGVNRVVVLAREDKPGNKRLVAYIVPEEDSKPSTSGLRNFLKKKLPEYMIPSVFIMLESLPLTPNGKVDRKALPAPDQKRPELDKKFVAPGTPTEIKLAEIWGFLLNLKEVGVNDNFFELGGHSLLATQLISRIADAFQVELPLRVVFEIPSIVEIALKIEHVKEKTGENEELGRLLDEVEGISDEEAQQRLTEN